MKRAVKILSVLLAIGAALMLAAICYYFAVTAGTGLKEEKLNLSASAVHIFDGKGREVNAASLGARESLSLSDLPETLPNAFLAVEDKDFYRHKGINYKRVVKAALKNIATFSFREGASTISQQLIKNTHLSGEKTINRKLREVKLARELERNYSKEEILQLYLNSIYFGHDSFGVSHAAQFYFGKSAKDLTPAECAMLAALAKSPNRYSPFKNAEKCLSRRNFVLGLMQEQGYLSDREYTEAVNSPLPEQPSQTKEKSAYLSRVYEELSELFPDAESGDFRNLKVYTFLDSDLQKQAEETQAESDYAVLVRDNRTHGIKALAATAGTPARLPASTIKPLAVYAPALEEKIISPATPLLDEEINFGGYSPKNYGGGYEGYMSARTALSKSVNVPAVKLMNTLGCEKSISYLNRMELYTQEGDCSLALALGGMKRGYTLLQLADGYAQFANGGNFTRSSAIARIESESGKELYRFREEKRPVFSEETCYLLNDMLQTAATEGTAKKLRNLPFPICAKTGTGGTDKGNTDAYTVSYTSEDTVAVWLGNADNTPINVTGGGAPANIAYRINQALYASHTPQPFPACEGVEEYAIDKEDYERNHLLTLADPAAPPICTLKELFRKDAAPQTVCTRFSKPAIEMPRISVKNGAVCIELCQTEYYDYIVKRENKGKTTVIYKGKYQNKIYDNSLIQGEQYVYTVIPLYKETEGTAVTLPSVRVEITQSEPDDWWN